MDSQLFSPAVPSCTEAALNTTTSSTNPFFLPPELWIATFTQLRVEVAMRAPHLFGPLAPDTRTLKQLLLVSHSFYTLTEPFIYEHVVITKSDSRNRDTRTKQIIKQLRKRPERKSWMHVLLLDRWKLTPSYRESSPPSNDLWNIILELRNLRALLLVRVTASASDLFKHLGGLKDFDALSIVSSVLEPDSSPMSEASTLNLQVLVLRGGRGDTLDHISKRTMGSSLKRLCHGTSYGSIVLSRISQTSFVHLVEYYMIKPSVQDIQGLFSVAHHLPNLTTLSIESEILIPPEVLPLPAGALPKLQTLSGPLWVILLIVPGHPVQELNIQRVPESGVPGGLVAYKQLGQGTAPVRTLDIKIAEWAGFTFGDLGALFPDLEELTIHLKGHSAVDVSVYPAFDCPSQTLMFFFPSISCPIYFPFEPRCMDLGAFPYEIETVP